MLPAPVYRPPLRGAPAGRVAGGTRGTDDELPLLQALSPGHVGLTINPQPSLYYILSENSDVTVEFAISPLRAAAPTLELRWQPPQTAGTHAIHLADFGIHLQPGIVYKWFVALVPDDEHRSQDVVTCGAIKMTDALPALKGALLAGGEDMAAHIYADSGLWYDALHSIARQIAARPDNPELAKAWSGLLEQAGLWNPTRQAR